MDEKPKVKIETRPWDAAEHLETEEDNPELATVLKVVQSLGLRLAAKTAAP